MTQGPHPIFIAIDHPKFRRAVAILLLLIIAGFLVIAIPALRRAQCEAFQLFVATWQRSVMQHVHEQQAAGHAPPSSYLRVIAAVAYENHLRAFGVETHCWEQKNAPIRVGNISLEDILEGRATLDDVDAEVARLNLPVPRWEVFGGLAFLVYDPGDQLRADLPVMLACMSKHPPRFNIGFEDGHTEFTRALPENIPDIQTTLSATGLPKIPQSYIDQNIIPSP